MKKYNKAIIRIILVIFIFNINICRTNCENIYWEHIPSAQKFEILNNFPDNDPLIDLYWNRLQPADDERTMAIMDSIVSVNKDDNRRALLFYLLNEIVSFSDGALSEAIGYYCIEFTYNNPAYVFEYFSRNKNTMIEYALHCGYIFAFEDKEPDMPQITYDMFIQKLKDEPALKEYGYLINDFNQMLMQTIKDTQEKEL